MSDAPGSIKRFCRRCKAHGFKVPVHSACPFSKCECPECTKISKTNEVARERVRKRCADETASLTTISSSTGVPVTVEQVLLLGNKNSQAQLERKQLSATVRQAGT